MTDDNEIWSEGQTAEYLTVSECTLAKAPKDRKAAKAALLALVKRAQRDQRSRGPR